MATVKFTTSWLNPNVKELKIPDRIISQGDAAIYNYICEQTNSESLFEWWIASE